MPDIERLRELARISPMHDKAHAIVGSIDDGTIDAIELTHEVFRQLAVYMIETCTAPDDLRQYVEDAIRVAS